ATSTIETGPYTSSRGALDLRDAGVDADIDSPCHELGESFSYLNVLPAQQQCRAVHHSDRGSECGKDVSKLGRDVAAANDDHGVRQLGQPHHRVGGVELH